MGKREQQQQNKRSYEQVEQGDDGIKTQQMDTSNDTNNNTGNKNSKVSLNNKKANNMSKKQQQLQDQANAKREDDEFEDADDEELDDEEDVVEEEEEIEEEVEEEEEEEDDEEDEGNETEKKGQKAGQASQGGAHNSGSNNASGNTDKRPRLSDELYEMNLRRKKEHVGSALYIQFPRIMTEDEVRNFVGVGPNIFLVGPQKQNAIVRYRTQSECEKQQKELSGEQFEGTTPKIEPKTVKIDPANIDVKTLITQFSSPKTIMDFAQVFIKAVSISLKGGKSKRESEEDLSFGSAIIVFATHEDAAEAFLATENLSIKGEQLHVVFADFRPAGPSFRKGGDNNRHFNRNNQGRSGGGRSGGGFRNRHGGGGGGGGNGGGNRNFGNRNFGHNQGGRNNFSPNKKFRPR